MFNFLFENIKILKINYETVLYSNFKIHVEYEEKTVKNGWDG